MAQEVFTIGHSNHPIEKFLELLHANRIQAVADVRSSPFSRFNPQFNREDLQNSLKKARIHYVFLGKELGARSEDPNCYIADKVQYDRLANTSLFQSGLDRVVEGAENYRIALMCAEKDPLDCHRAILVARELVKRGLLVTHILDDGTIENHTDSMSRLVRLLGIPLDDMFRSREDIIEEAYTKQTDKIAYNRRDRQPGHLMENDSLVIGRTAK
ncbi:MAG: DUF488 family protein [Rectinemataceae bacterium]